jgi:hypothetical protein
METKNRLQQLLDPSNTTLNGIDFIEVVTTDQRTLRVHFQNKVAVRGTIAGMSITGGETIPTVKLPPQVDVAGNWSLDPAGRPQLTFTVPTVGDFSDYTLTIVSNALDLFYRSVKLSFKANCPSDLDCAPAPTICPPLPGEAPPIDYLAKDFLSFRKALSDFSALRYPEWQERAEADFGVMFMEALCSLADDLSYTQDRVAAEATLATATQRRSIVRLARLVDYEPLPAISAQVLLQFDVLSSPLSSGLVVSAAGPDGTQVSFETGRGLIDPTTGKLNTATYPVSPLWNRYQKDGKTPNLRPYYWDDTQRCLNAGATEMWIMGQGYQFKPGQALLIDTAAATAADPPIREVFHLVSADEELDPLFLTNAAPTPVTHIVWQSNEARREPGSRDSGKAVYRELCD